MYQVHCMNAIAQAGLDRLGDILANRELRASGKYIISPEK